MTAVLLLSTHATKAAKLHSFDLKTIASGGKAG